MTNKKNNPLLNLRILQLIITLIIFSSITLIKDDIEEFILPNVFQYLQIVLAGVWVLLYIMEWRYKKAYARLIFFAMAIIYIIAQVKAINELNSAIWIFSLIYAVIMIVVVLLTKTPPISSDSNEESNFKTLPFGIFNKKQGFISLIYSIAGIVFIVLSTVLIKKYTSFSFLYITIPLSIIFFIVLIYISIKTSPLNIILNNMNRTCEYNEMMEEFSKLKENNLHEESLVLIKVCEANYTMVVDMDKANFIWNEIKDKELSNKGYVSIFLQVEIGIAINNKEYELAVKLINEFETKFQKIKNIKTITNKYLNLIKSEQTEEEITNIEELFPLNDILLFTNINNAHTLMCYYHKQNIESETKKELAKYIIKSAPELLILVQDAQNILNN